MAMNEDTELSWAICPYKRCGGMVKQREDGEYHCDKCGSEINERYAVFEGTKGAVIRKLVEHFKSN